MLRDCPLSFGAGPLEMLPMRSRYFNLFPIIIDGGDNDDEWGEDDYDLEVILIN